jgi:hypothetical protein
MMTVDEALQIAADLAPVSDRAQHDHWAALTCLGTALRNERSATRTEKENAEAAHRAAMADALGALEKQQEITRALRQSNEACEFRAASAERTLTKRAEQAEAALREMEADAKRNFERAEKAERAVGCPEDVGCKEWVSWRRVGISALMKQRDDALAALKQEQAIVYDVHNVVTAALPVGAPDSPPLVDRVRFIIKERDDAKAALAAEAERWRNLAKRQAGELSAKDDLLASTQADAQRDVAEAERVAAERVGADPEVRDLLLYEFGTTEPALLREAIAQLRKASEYRAVAVRLAKKLEDERLTVKMLRTGLERVESDCASVLRVTDKTDDEERREALRQSVRQDIAASVRRLTDKEGSRD